MSETNDPPSAAADHIAELLEISVTLEQEIKRREAEARTADVAGDRLEAAKARIWFAMASAGMRAAVDAIAEILATAPEADKSAIVAALDRHADKLRSMGIGASAGSVLPFKRPD